MIYAPTQSYRKRRKRRKGYVLLDVEKFEVLGLSNMEHWCSGCKRMQRFTLNETEWHWNCNHCGHRLILQQLIIEGRLCESKYRGIEQC